MGNNSPSVSNILLCGVGGQGTILAGGIISSALMKAGYDVKQSDVHGMAQRGGSVISHIRCGEKVYSPLIEPGSADIVASFELLETLRYLSYFNKNTRVIVNTQKILPAPASAGMAKYPPYVLGQLKRRGLDVFPFNAFDIAKTAGDARAANMVITGALSVFMDTVDKKIFLKVIEEKTTWEIRKFNIKAFLKGRELAMQLSIK